MTKLIARLLAVLLVSSVALASIAPAEAAPGIRPGTGRATS